MELGMSLCEKNRVILCVCVCVYVCDFCVCVVFSSVYVTLNITVTCVNFSPKIHITIAL